MQISPDFTIFIQSLRSWSYAMQISCRAILAAIIFPVFSDGLTAQPAFESENQSYKYNIYRDIWFDYQISESSDSFHIFFQLDFITDVNPDDDLHIYYELRKDYANKGSGFVNSLNSGMNCLYHSLNTYIYYSSVLKSQEMNVLVLHIEKNGGGYHYQYDLPLSHPSIFPYPALVLYSSKNKAPALRPFIHIGDSIYLRSVDPAIKKTFIFWYKTQFDAADPPMYLIDKKVNKSLSYDSVFTNETGRSFVFPGTGLYFIQSDTTDPEGLSIRCEKVQYPKLVTVEEIFDPIIYLSTKEELDRLKQANDKKGAFEDYWLKVAKSEQKARRIIRGYYQKIEEANIYFTTYKEGWKTDMGMIYLFFGAPDEVYNNGNSEKWNYEKNEDMPSVSFTFERLRSVFSDTHYILLRQQAYQSQWFKKVDQWRKGLAFQSKTE